MTPKYYERDSKGELIFVGRYNLDIRDAYIRYKVQAYLIDHPGAHSDMAFRAVRQGWKRKATESIEKYRARQVVRV